MTTPTKSLKTYLPLLLLSLTASRANAEVVDPALLDACPGYNAQNVSVVDDGTRLVASLVLAGEPCNVFGGEDLKELELSVVYDTDTRIHLRITDPTSPRYEVPESVLPLPSNSTEALSFDTNDAQIKFNYTTEPFSFSLYRPASNTTSDAQEDEGADGLGELMATTAGYPLIFTERYIRVKFTLPPASNTSTLSSDSDSDSDSNSNESPSPLDANATSGANIYGLGEHTSTFRLPNTNYTRTLWARDAYGVPVGTNLYSSHPVWFEQREGNVGTWGVFLRSSEGMDVKLDSDSSDSAESQTNGTTVEYNILGGILDFYFLAGSSTDPVQVAKQYADVVGKPAEVPYWGFGLHQCRFGYKSYVDVAEVIGNYSEAGIPLETMWTDIDYMYERRIFTLDPDYFPLERMREVVDYLHGKGQKYIVMTDPAVYHPRLVSNTSSNSANANDTEDYAPYTRGTELDVWLKNENGSEHLGLVWPGVVVYPDWFSENVEEYWTNEFKMFYDAETGLDIDGAWIDMNEPSSFCDFPCQNPWEQAAAQALPPPRSGPTPAPDVPIFGGSTNGSDSNTNSSNTAMLSVYANTDRGLQERMWKRDEYEIDNAAGGLSNKTAHVTTVHANGLSEYDAHNLYGTMMSSYTQKAMSARRPGKKTLIITRSTFAGAGTSVGKWLGDNFSRWEHYRFSIAGQLGMASVFQVPMVGSDICGFGENTTETLCARWATLGAFSPFMRNHNGDTSISQEFYRWESVTAAAKNALDMRYRLLDYIYTAFHQAHLDGTPVLNPLFYIYPKETQTYPIDLQFFYGPSILVSPVTEENSTSVTAYFAQDVFYDLKTLKAMQGNGTWQTFDDVAYEDILVHVRGGQVVPLRVESAMTTEEVRGKNFELVVAPAMEDGSAAGQLYFDDGESVEPESSTLLTFTYTNGTLEVAGEVGMDLGVDLERVRIAGVGEKPGDVKVDGESVDSVEYDEENAVLTVPVGKKFESGLKVEVA